MPKPPASLPPYAALVAAAALLLSGCAVLAPADGADDSAAADPARQAPAPVRAAPVRAFGDAWSPQLLPTKAATTYRAQQHAGREAIAATANGSASLLRRQVRIEPAGLGRLQLSWMVEQLIADADMAARDRDDSPVRVVLAFEGDRSRFSARDAAASELSQLLTGEPLPYATLMYVWCNRRPAGTLIENPRTSRIRKLVLESGAGALGRWRDYVRDVRADYERAFGEPPGALVGVALMTDADNTRARVRAWYGALRWLPPEAAQSPAAPAVQP